MLMTKDDKNVCFNSNRQNIQSDLSYNITTEIGATDTTGLRTEYMDRIYAAISYKILYLAIYCFFLVISWLALQIKINLFST